MRTRRRCITSEFHQRRFAEAISRFDAENAQDPNREPAEGGTAGRELLQARRLTAWVRKLDANPSEELLLAARCQHICRWKVPRGDYPADRAGYHRWRNGLKEFHARIAGGILRECGYDEATIGRVQALNLKTNFPRDPESQTMEDALCLVFLEFQFAELAARTDRGKMINALRKSWAKMSPPARALALAVKFGEPQAELLVEALGIAISP